MDGYFGWSYSRCEVVELVWFARDIIIIIIIITVMYRLTNGKFCNERYNVTTRFVMHEGA